MGWPTPRAKPLGAYGEGGLVKTLPLLFAKTVEVIVPKKLMAKPTATERVDPPSFAGNVFAPNAERFRAAVEAIAKAFEEKVCVGVGIGRGLI